MEKIQMQTERNPFKPFMYEVMRNSRGESDRESGAREDVWMMIGHRTQGEKEGVVAVEVLKKLRDLKTSWNDICEMIEAHAVAHNEYVDFFSGIEYLHNRLFPDSGMGKCNGPFFDDDKDVVRA